MRYYLGLDNGGTTTKAGLYTKDGSEIGVASVETKMNCPAQGMAERDMIEMKEANFEVIRKVIKKTKVKAEEIVGLAVCGHGKGLYLVGKDSNPVRPGIISTDNRAWKYPVDWKNSGVAKQVYQKTYQEIMACQPVALLAWLRDYEPDIMDEIGWIFECKDYVRYILTGQAKAEITDYSGSNLLNLETKDYDQELMDLYGLGGLMDALPPLCISTDVCGSITEEVAHMTGLKAGTPVFGGMFDINACALAVGAAKEERVCMIAGTWSINEYIRKQPVLDGSVAMNSLFVLPEYYLIEESSPTSAGNNEWFIKTFLSELAEKAILLEMSVYDIANDMVGSVPITEFCPIFLPFLMASNVHPNGKGCFMGMTTYHTRAHMIKSVYEGIAFSHRYHFEKLLKSRTEPVSVIRLAGGVAKSDQWVQIFADIMKHPVEVADINETGTLGCAMNVAVAVGDYENYQEAASNMIRISKRVEPNLGHSDIYDHRYKGYMDLVNALDGYWPSLQELMDKTY